MGKSLYNIVEDCGSKIKKNARAAGLAGIITLSSLGAMTGCEGTYIGPGACFFRDKDDENPYKTGRINKIKWGSYKKCVYVGEYLDDKPGKSGIHHYYLHGYGTLFDKDGNVIRDGYWKIGQPVDEDPLKDIRRKSK